MSDNFYRAFEERYYAPRDLIKSIRRQYLPFVEPLASIYPGGCTFDLGCGRGEWLELMSEQGLTPFGVDLDAGMLQACEERGLPATQGDAVAYLKTLESDSQVVVSAFHVVEHITFEQLQTVVSEALRVLRPGGLLILETPNPENIAVATNNFHLDPTHQKPIPSLLLSFVVEHGGFETVKTLRLQESPALRNPDHAVSLLDVIRGASPDYAVVAQKTADPETRSKFAQVFAAEYGLSLEQLADRYDVQTESVRMRMEKAEAGVERLDELARVISGQLHLTQERLQSVEADLDAGQRQVIEDRLKLAEERCRHAEELRQHAENQLGAVEARAQQAEAQARHANEVLHAVLHSTSWRVSKPVRMVGVPLRRLTSAIREGRLMSGVKTRIKGVLRVGAAELAKRPALKRAALRLVRMSPALDRRLRAVVTQSASVAVSSPLSQRALPESVREVLDELRAAARASESR
ncbi:class I SAM-dependent methyltransferase [Burkholderia sp. RF2-non_BP3]|uniref:class I SAM-dependent methyltransferase n=1 Tax=Burkholderia sp. RF2-non_BP3 TaxID=1637844 RepID=UPI00075371CF|nr:class I SAM-dependent methyltransferase [Burkholderia sp. RF2-non_BP3]KUY58368.1 methyltransferase type 11 [Burkholderia sp. RF2-non_BP3]